ncbi:potassium-transporting ATPase subunit KdpB [Brachybacterium kimchii]|uniref:Potassium-transporting ATPase ATP-binding subunit n=1 Tax=Brachybacterium kimchii TaxID=2942909 RepID=A0ABY4N445_9MICO|nr:potassium-transporting ATPase subunit KdpB [Brachybacterium kimchii]UQN29346.1 potassium-transporting ATPase subunit KdpB [Brachybacterium kimchii]
MRSLDAATLRAALPGALRKLDPRRQWRSPVMLLVWAGAVLTSALAIAEPFLGGPRPSGGAPVPVAFTGAIAVWLWLTVLFANLAESVAEGRGKAQAASLRRTRTRTSARRLVAYAPGVDPSAEHTEIEEIPSAELAHGDIVLVAAGETIPGDGDVVHGIATVDESAITGESAPVVRESGGDRSAVTGGTRVLSDRILVRITSRPGETFVDRMISLIEGSARQRTPNEIALGILLAGLSIVFVIVVLTLNPIAALTAAPVSIPVLVALLVCLVPTTIGALLSAIGIAGMDRLVQHNVLAMSGRAVEAAGDVSTLLLDKTGTITYGGRRATAIVPAPGVSERELLAAAALSSAGDPTPEGTSILDLAAARATAQAAERPGDPHVHAGSSAALPVDTTLVPFTAVTRMSGLDQADGTRIRKGAVATVVAWLIAEGSAPDQSVRAAVEAEAETIARAGGTPLAVAVHGPAGTPASDSGRLLGVVHLKDVVKEGLPEKFAQLRQMGIRTVMITGDNPLTARAIADEAGVDDVLAEATPEDKLARIRAEQEGGRLVAMTGDGTNDAPALAQADVGMAMNSGTSAAKEAGNMVDLDSDPSKLIDVVRIGKQLLMTRGALTTFSIANDIAKYFAIVPAMFLGAVPQLQVLNVMGLHSPASAVLSAIIFNALVILALIPLALRGVRHRPSSPSRVLGRNLLVYGLGGVLTPFAGIWLIDHLVRLLPGF